MFPEIEDTVFSGLSNSNIRKVLISTRNYNYRLINECVVPFKI
jgi:hypothetical protein